MAKTVTINDSIGFVPSGYITGASITTNNSYPISNGYRGVSNTSSYARLQMGASNVTTDCYLYYTFDIQGIPSSATINSVTCVARVYINSRVSGATLQLYSGTSGKGAATSFSNTSASNITIANTGSWTVSELSNLRLRVQGRRNTTNNNGHICFYGSDLTITYTYQENVFEVSARSETDIASVTPLYEEVVSGTNYVLRIDVDDVSKIVVSDNGTDVTNLLVEHEVVNSGTTSSVAKSFTTGASSSNANFYTSAYQTGTSRLEYPINYSAESHNPVSDTGYTYVKDGGSNNSTAWINYAYDFSAIPENATIVSVDVKAYGARESTTTSSTYMAKLGVYAGSTLKGSEQEFTSTSNTIVTLSNVGTWTRSELQNANLRFTVAYYGGRIFGTTWTVVYSVHSDNQYYYTYTISNINADHSIVVEEDVIVPPEEDPTKEYYPVTISSINARTVPARGTTRIESGTSETITIYPSDPLITLVTDNGVDVSSQLVQHGGTIPTPTVTTAQGASYGFNYSASTGYYVSANKGVDESAAVCVVGFDLPVSCLVTIQFINYAEASYDFGVFGNIDTALSNNYYAAGSGGATITDTNYKLACNTSSYNTANVQTITYEVPSGQHQIYIKYSKDDGTSSNNDTLQFKIYNIEELETNNYYTYDLSNISQEHSLIFVFGNVTYYLVNSTTNSDCILYPNGQMVQLPGEDYHVTIIPNNSGDTVTVTDNNVDVTSSLERKEAIVEKDGVQTTVVNYIYRINNVQASHNINVSSISPSQGCSGYVKRNGSWVQANINIKSDDRWREVTHIYGKIDGDWDDATSMQTKIIGVIVEL